MLINIIVKKQDIFTDLNTVNLKEEKIILSYYFIVEQNMILG